MTPDEMKSLDRGDIVRHILSPNSYVIVDRIFRNDGSFALVGVHTVLITNPPEWEKFERNK